MLMITTDVAKAYYQVPLHKDSQPYCAWRHNGEWIIPTVITFGISVAPFVFTKIMKVVLRFARLLLIRRGARTASMTTSGRSSRPE
jgi:hypothetical protein